MLNFRTLPLFGSRLIEASAGTGKTYTIALLYVRLVLGHGQSAAFATSLTPQEILVVTFTDAASQELRDRIRQRLHQAASWFRDPESANPDDPLHELLSDYDDLQRPLAVRKLEAAAESMDEAAISTIHSWCYRMLRELAFNSRLLFNQQLNTKPDELLVECVEDYWRIHFYPFTESLALATAISNYWKSQTHLLTDLRPLLSKPNLAPVFCGDPVTVPETIEPLLQAIIADQEEFQSWQEECGVQETTARTAFLNGWPEIAARLQQAELNISKYHKGVPRDTFIASVRLWANGGPRPGGDETKLFRLATGRFEMRRGCDAPTHAAFDAMARWASFWDQMPQPPAVPPHIPLLLHAAKWVERERQARMLSSGELSLDDLLLRLHAALHDVGGERLADTIREKYPFAMIDEFQDTDAIQYEIFDRIYHVHTNDPQSGLVMIGDPKQAIYGFRGADIYTYLRAKAACSPRCDSLGTNFRSTAEMVAAVNRVFSLAEQHPSGAFRFRTPGQDPVPFQEVASQDRPERLLFAGQPVPSLNVWYLPGGQPNGVTGPGEYREHLAESTASEIVRWLKMADNGEAGFQELESFRRLQPRDIAILVRTGREAALIRRSLQRRGVPSVYLSDKDSVFDTTEAQDVLRWLQAAAHPADERLLKSAMCTSSLRIPLPELRQSFDDELKWEGVIMRFRKYQEIWQSQGVLPMLRAMLWDHQTPRRLMAEPSGERVLTNLLHLAEWLQQTSPTVDGELALIRQLALQIQHPTDEQILRLESDADLIKVITIHKSKGLEYPLVLLPFVCSFTNLSDKNVVRFQHTDLESGKKRLATELAGKRDLAPQSYAAAEVERISEDVRLLYVAMTRAQHALWLGVTPLAEAKKRKDHALDQTAVGYLLMGDQKLDAPSVYDRILQVAEENPSIAVTQPPAINFLRHQSSVATELTQARQAKPRRETRWWIASYSALRTQEYASTNLSSQTPAPETDWDISERDDNDGTELPDSLPTEIPPQVTRPLDMHDFPRGPHAGTFLHSVLEWATAKGFDRIVNEPLVRQTYLLKSLQRYGWESWADVLDKWLTQLLNTQLRVGDTGLRLSELPRSHCQAELEFWIETRRMNTLDLDRLVTGQTLSGYLRPPLMEDWLNGLLKGFIDLVFELQGRYYILDWKSNYLGPSSDSYDAESLQRGIAEKRYEMQYVLYLVALHRHLRHRLPGYRYEANIGGAVYVFLRGIDHVETRGVHFECPPYELIREIDERLQGATALESASWESIS